MTMINKRSRRYLVLAIAVMMLLVPAFIDSAVGLAQSRSSKKPAPTPKKKATPTPKRAKATPTPKKSQSKTAKTKPTPKSTPKTAKSSKTAGKTNKASDKSKTAKTTERNRNSKSSKTEKSAPKATKAPVKPVARTTPRPAPKVSEKTVPQIIVSGYSVPLRSQARSSAPTVTRVRIGTPLKVIQKDGSWYRVKLDNGGRSTEGWIAADSISESADQSAYRRIVERNYRDDLDFPAASELFEYMTSASPKLEASDASAELELRRLLVLRSALKGLRDGQSDSAAGREFVKKNETAIVYSEPAGEYYVAANQFWDLHAKYRKSVISDRIAWEAALNPLPGECEGYVNCYLFDIRMRFGEYLNHHPNGKNSAEALTNITNYLEPIVADASRKEVYYGPTDVSDRAEFNNLIAELRTIVARLGFVEKERTLQQLRVIAEGYK